MTAPVRIEAEAWSDLRFATLARLMGFADLDHALIKVGRIWSWQAEHYTPDAPTYVVDADLIESALGPGGAAAMVRSRLAEEEPGGFRIRGTRGRIEWLWQRRQASAKGGEAMKRSAAHKTRPSGHPTARPSGKPAAEPGPGPKPSPLPLVPALVPEDQTLSLARAIAPELPEPCTARSNSFDAEAARHRANGHLAEAMWASVSDLRVKHAKKLGLVDVMPFPTIVPSNHPRGFRELSQRIREEGDNAHAACDHVLAVLDKQATDEKSIEWLAEKAFLAGPWEKARNTVLKQRKPAERAPEQKPAPIAPENLAGSAELAKAWELLGIAKEPA